MSKGATPWDKGGKVVRGGKAGKGPGNSGKGAATNPGYGGRDRPQRGWGSTGGRAGRDPGSGGFFGWLFGGGE